MIYIIFGYQNMLKEVNKVILWVSRKFQKSDKGRLSGDMVVVVGTLSRARKPLFQADLSSERALLSP